MERVGRALHRDGPPPLSPPRPPPFKQYKDGHDWVLSPTISNLLRPLKCPLLPPTSRSSLAYVSIVSPSRQIAELWLTAPSRPVNLQLALPAVSHSVHDPRRRGQGAIPSLRRGHCQADPADFCFARSRRARQRENVRARELGEDVSSSRGRGCWLQDCDQDVSLGSQCRHVVRQVYPRPSRHVRKSTVVPGFDGGY